MIRQFSWIVMMLLLPLTATAVMVDQLGQVTLKVADSSKRERQQAVQDGLAEVVVRLSGQQQVLVEAAIADLLQKAERYLLQYQYMDGEVDPGTKKKQKLLSLTFDEKAVTRYLKRAGLPVWGANRAAVMVWWVVEEDGEREIVTSDSEHPALDGLKLEAKRRGVPLVFPIMDLQDSQNVSEGDVWGFFLDKIRFASKRYGTDNLLVGKTVQLDLDKFKSSWIISVAEGEDWHDSVADAASEQWMGAIDNMADTLAKKYSVVMLAEPDAGFKIRVNHIQSLNDYVNVQSYLSQLTPVRKATLESVQGDSLILQLVLNGDLQQFKEVLALDNKLLSAGEGTANVEPKPDALPLQNGGESGLNDEAGGDAPMLTSHASNAALDDVFLQFDWVKQ